MTNGNLEEILIGATSEAHLLEKVEFQGPRDSKKIDQIYERYKTLLRQMIQMKNQLVLVFDDPARERLFQVDLAASAIISHTNKFQYSSETHTKLMTLYNERIVELMLLIRAQVLA